MWLPRNSNRKLEFSIQNMPSAMGHISVTDQDILVCVKIGSRGVQNASFKHPSNKHQKFMYKSRAAIPESAGLCRRSPWSPLLPFCSDQPSAGTVRETVYRWRPGLPSRRTDHLEQSAGQRDLCSISFYLPSASENVSSRLHFLTLSSIPVKSFLHLQWILK